MLSNPGGRWLCWNDQLGREMGTGDFMGLPWLGVVGNDDFVSKSSHGRDSWIRTEAAAQRGQTSECLELCSGTSHLEGFSLQCIKGNPHKWC